MGSIFEINESETSFRRTKFPTAKNHKNFQLIYSIPNLINIKYPILNSPAQTKKTTSHLTFSLAPKTSLLDFGCFFGGN